MHSIIVYLSLFAAGGPADEAAAAAPPASADWPTFRGPGGRGVSPDAGFPERWEPARGIEWTLDLPGWGNSSAVVAGDRLYVTTQTDDDALNLVAVDRSRGAIAWKRSLGRGRLKAHQLHNMATPTPAAERDRVWALFGTGDLAALDRDGNVLWRNDLRTEHGEYKILWGMGSSPMLRGDLLYLVCMHGGPSYLLALDKRTGKQVWKVERNLPCVAEATDSYSTPVVLEDPKRAELIVNGADHLTGYDPATGKQLWISAGLKIPHNYGRTMASPGVGEGIVVGCSASVQALGKIIAVRPGGEGDVTDSRRLWQYEKFTPDCPTPLCYQGRVYVVRDDGVGSCLDATTGELLWKNRMGSGGFKASPVAADGKVYFLTMDGDCIVLRAGPKYEVIAENHLDGSFIATPALSGGRIYLRSKDRLYAVGGSKK